MTFGLVLGWQAQSLGEGVVRDNILAGVSVTDFQVVGDVGRIPQDCIKPNLCRDF